MFSYTSRYYGIETAKLEVDEETTIVYVRRRFLPPSSRFDLLQMHTVVQGDRLDNIAARYIGDPELFWRICDANNAMRPEDLTAPENLGHQLRITLPEGIPGSPYA
jgi:hypothetical protein